MKDKMVVKTIIHIVGTLLFMILATIFIYVPKNEELAASLAFLDNHENFYIDNSAINLEKNYPVSDNVGLTTTANTFKVINNTNKDKTYKLILQTGNREKYDNVIDNSSIRYSIKVNDGNYSTPRFLSDDGVIDVGTALKNTENTYELKIWIDTDDVAKINNKIFQGIIKIDK